ncbi:uncharacterized protein LOC141596790 [Silene latifolia]|uniref:uncharacterized protein LOC141596790 n=1 Tax=Silene latifolia TaxID=37657 RepID=UPI003D76E726
MNMLIKPSSTSHTYYHHQNPFHKSVSFISFTFFKKKSQKRLRLYASSAKLPHNHSLPINLLSVLAPVLQKIRNFSTNYTWGSSHTQNPSVNNIVDSKKTSFLHNGGINMALLTVKSTAKTKFSPIIASLAANPTFISGLLALLLAQSMKVVLNFFVERKWDFRIMFASGGMPSSHSALCTALTTSVALCHGVSDSLFPVCLGFSLVVMYDAIGVRRHAGMQAQVLNKIIEDLFQGHPISERKLKELLGHTPSQVVAGALLGIAVAGYCCQSCLVPI